MIHTDHWFLTSYLTLVSTTQVEGLVSSRSRVFNLCRGDECKVPRFQKGRRMYDLLLLHYPSVEDGTPTPVVEIFYCITFWLTESRFLLVTLSWWMGVTWWCWRYDLFDIKIEWHSDITPREEVISLNRIWDFRFLLWTFTQWCHSFWYISVTETTTFPSHHSFIYNVWSFDRWEQCEHRFVDDFEVIEPSGTQ